MKVVVAGDYCDDGRVSEVICKRDYAFLFDSVNNFIEGFDFRIVNFEFPVVQERGREIPKEGPCLRGHREAIDAIKYAGFNVCTLANNHILDQGEQCCMDTIRLLNDAGIKTVGAGKDIHEAMETLYLQKDDERLAIINCCEHEFTIAAEHRAGANPLNPIRQYYKILEAKTLADYIVVIVHGGHEYFQLPSPRMQETYRFFIDAGADVVVNHHQHCFSGYEKYKGKYIFYGLGNFLFDDISRNGSSWNEGFMLGLEFADGCLKTYQLRPYIQCYEKATVRLMDGKDLVSFHGRIDQLNDVIANEELLSRDYTVWLKNSCVFLPGLFEPWQGKLTSALYRRGLLPTTFDERRKLKLMNYIWCESHLDRLRYVFNDA